MDAEHHPCPCCDDAPVAVVMEGDATWHDGAGWYYVDDEYRDEGSCGAFATRDEAVAHAREAGYFVRPEPLKEPRRGVYRARGGVRMKFDWEAVENAAKLIAREADSASYAPSWATDIHVMRAGRVCEQWQHIVEALHLDRMDLTADEWTAIDGALGAVLSDYNDDEQHPSWSTAKALREKIARLKLAKESP